MYVIIVYDTESKNCAKLHRQLKKYLNWNQNSVFEGSVTQAQYVKIKDILETTRVDQSHITIYSLDNEKLLKKEELGSGKGNTSNII